MPQFHVLGLLFVYKNWIKNKKAMTADILHIVISVIFHRDSVTPAAATSSSATAAASTSTSNASNAASSKSNAKNNESVLLVIR